jgi:hypothetical protein
MIGPQPADRGVDRRVAKFVWKRQKIMRRKALPRFELRVSGRFALKKLLASLPLRIAMVPDLQPVRMLREIRMGVVLGCLVRTSAGKAPRYHPPRGHSRGAVRLVSARPYEGAACSRSAGDNECPRHCGTYAAPPHHPTSRARPRECRMHKRQARPVAEQEVAERRQHWSLH